MHGNIAFENCTKFGIIFALFTKGISKMHVKSLKASKLLDVPSHSSTLLHTEFQSGTQVLDKCRRLKETSRPILPFLFSVLQWKKYAREPRWNEMQKVPKKIAPKNWAYLKKRHTCLVSEI